MEREEVRSVCPSCPLDREQSLRPQVIHVRLVVLLLEDSIPQDGIPDRIRVQERPYGLSVFHGNGRREQAMRTGRKRLSEGGPNESPRQARGPPPRGPSLHRWRGQR